MNPFRDQTAVLVDLAAEYSRAQKATAVNCEDPPDSLGMSPA